MGVVWCEGVWCGGGVVWGWCGVGVVWCGGGVRGWEHPQVGDKMGFLTFG